MFFTANNVTVLMWQYLCPCQWSNCKTEGRGTLWRAREREPIMGAWGGARAGSSGRAPGQIRGALPPEAEDYFASGHSRACRFFGISQRSVWFSF